YLYSIDLATGLATPIGPTGFEDVEGLAFDRRCETLYAVDDVTDRLLTCDVETGACTQVGQLGVDITDTGLAFLDDGTLLMSTDGPKEPTRLYRVDRSTGEATAIGDQGQEVTGLAADDHRVIGLGGDQTNNLVRIDPATGHATPLGRLRTVELSDGGLDFDSSGILWGLEDAGLRHPGRVFTVDTETGAATVVATIHDDENDELGGFEGLAVEEGVCAVMTGGVPVPTEVPALSGWGLAALTVLLTGIGLFLLRRH
ncbi:MAG TPA: hypothetical protein DD490_12110, partial [Acidobacteria bacterium]|nr:hypothetical protein [Acidobacteriota bacterium]